MGDSKLSDIPPSGRPKTAGVEPPVVWPARAAMPNRHAAISRQLFSYTHYKVWADKMRIAWQDEEVAAEEEVTPTR